MREQEIEKKLKRKKLKKKLKKKRNQTSVQSWKISFVRKEEFLFHLSAHAYYFLNFYSKMSTRESQVIVMNNGPTPV